MKRSQNAEEKGKWSGSAVLVTIDNDTVTVTQHDILDPNAKFKKTDLSEVVHGLGYIPSNKYPCICATGIVAPVAHYPPGHNPFLEKSLVKKMEMLDPCDFVTFIMEKLTPKERNSVMRFEKYRRKSFETGWRHENVGQLSGNRLARAGFYYTGSEDRVKCAFCSVGLEKWQADEHPVTEHQKHFPSCDFLADRTRSGDIPYTGEFDYGKNVTSHISRRGQHQLLGISTERAHHPHLAAISVRNNTFNDTNCPQFMVRNAPEFASAGFAYTRWRDQVVCFYCGIKVNKWREGDDAWAEHVRLLPDCGHVLEKKGITYVNAILDDLPPSQKPMKKGVAILEQRDPTNPSQPPSSQAGADEFPPSEPAGGDGEVLIARHSVGSPTNTLSNTELQSTATVMRHQLTCKVCLSSVVGIIFLPCGHLVCCIECAPAMSDCPICRVKIQGTVKMRV